MRRHVCEINFHQVLQAFPTGTHRSLIAVWAYALKIQISGHKTVYTNDPLLNTTKHYIKLYYILYTYY